MIFDTKLHKQHETDIRNFFQIQFLNQIKNSNILKLINKQVYQSDYVDDSIPNPAEVLGNKLASVSRGSTRDAGLSTSFGRGRHQVKYKSDPYAQDTVNNVIEPLMKLIKYDPKFSDLNTIVDMIPVGHSEIFVPMVIGTKVTKIQTGPLFWILYFTVGHLEKHTHNTISLDSIAGTIKLKNIVRQVTSHNYEDYFGLPVKVKDKTLSDNVDYKQVSMLKSGMFTAIKRFEDVLDGHKFMQDLSMSENTKLNVTLSKTIADSAQIRNSIISQASGMFGSLLANEVVPLLHSMVNMLMSPDELSNDTKEQIRNEKDRHRVHRLTPTTISKFVEHIVGALQSNTDALFRNITSAVEANLEKNNHVHTGNDDAFFSGFAATCNNVSNVSVEGILQEISSANFSIVGASRDSIESFVEKLSKISSQLRTHINYIEKDIIGLSLDSSRVNDMLTNYNKDTIQNLKNFMSGIVEDWQSTGFSDRLLSVIGLNSTKFNTKVFLLDLIDSITSIVTFLAIYTYISYLCNYFSYIHATVEKSKGSAIEFPNYALVIDADIIKVLYLNLAITVYKEEVKTPQTKSVVTNPKVTEQHLMNMIRIMQQKLKIPNLIVIDGNDVYYKFMFHRTNSIQKIGLSNLKSYNKHFKPTH